MASMEFIQKRIAGAEAKIAKLEKKLERIEKAEDTGWEVNPYYYSESDKRWTIRDLEEARQNLEKYRAELTTAIEKASSRNVPAILKFLEMWKARCTEYFGNGLVEYYAEKKMVYELGRKVETFHYGTPEREEAEKAFQAASDAFWHKRCGYFEHFDEVRNGRRYVGKTKIQDGEYEYLDPYSRERTYEEAMIRLKKDLDEEANRKYDFIIERTNAIVGKITDAGMLEIGAKGDLNGYIKGEKATAKVLTIGAGGYNIQCYHFRTLIHKA